MLIVSSRSMTNRAKYGFVWTVLSFHGIGGAIHTEQSSFLKNHRRFSVYRFGYQCKSHSAEPWTRPNAYRFFCLALKGPSAWSVSLLLIRLFLIWTAVFPTSAGLSTLLSDDGCSFVACISVLLSGSVGFASLCPCLWGLLSFSWGFAFVVCFFGCSLAWNAFSTLGSWFSLCSACCNTIPLCHSKWAQNHFLLRPWDAVLLGTYLDWVAEITRLEISICFGLLPS